VVDRDFGQRVLERYPLTRHIARAHRHFLTAAVRRLTDLGVRQFLDIGAGVLTSVATHEIAPSARVVYADHDPIAVAHAELALDAHGDPRRHAVIEADLRAPEELWQRVLDTELLDSGEPVAVLLIAVMHLRQPDAFGREVGPEAIAALRDLLPRGSHLAISHTTDDGADDAARDTLTGLQNLYDQCGGAGVTWRSRTDIAALLGDFRPVGPGWATANEWHCGTPVTGGSAVWAGLGTKP
jgi:tRNA(Arg) A34 adenosine deaminase TadA